MEKKVFQFSITNIEEKANDSGVNVAIVEGYAAVTGNLDQGRDRIIKGAFAKGLKSSKGKWPIQRNHSYKIEDTVGENVSAKEDDKGLFVRMELNLDTESGRDTYSKAKHANSTGRKMGLSIGYITLDWEYKTVKGIEERHLKSITVVEHSYVVFPMNQKATVTTIKSICEEGDVEAIALKKRALEQLLRDEGCSDDEAKAGISAIFSKRDAEEAEEAEAKAKEQEEADLIKSLSELNVKIKGDSNE